MIDEPDSHDLLYRREISPVNEWDQYAASWDTDSGPRVYAAAAYASLQRVLSDAGAALEGARVIDFGCGTGLLTERLVAAGSTVHAVDTSPAMLDILDTKITQHRWDRVRTGTSLPAEREAFDLVVCSSVCAFLDDYPATVEDWSLASETGGCSCNGTGNATRRRPTASREPRSATHSPPPA